MGRNLARYSKNINGKAYPRPEYQAWHNMIRRCTNPHCKTYEFYGEKGVTVCDRWLESFEHFLLDMGLRPSDGHSLDRINTYGNYEPENCRWATRQQQAENKRYPRRPYRTKSHLAYLEWKASKFPMVTPPPINATHNTDSTPGVKN